MKIGLSCGGVTGKYGLEKGLKLIKESGFDAIDLNVCSFYVNENSVFYNASEDEFLSYFNNIKKVCNDLELEISQTHGMLTVCVPDLDETKKINWGSEMEIKATAVLGAPYCVFHSVKKRQWEFVNLEPDFLHKQNVEFFQNILTPICEKYNVKFAIETHGLTALSTGDEMDFIGDANVLKENFDMIKSEYKAFCLDTGHTNEIVRLGAPTVPETVRILGKDIKVLHLHDNEGYHDSHLPPLITGKNNINWEETFNALDEIGYNGVYNYELNLGRFGTQLDDYLNFLGKFLREFTQNKGKI